MADHIRATEGRHYHTRGVDSSPKETQWVYHSHHYRTDPLGHDNVVEKWATHGNTASIGHNFLKEASGMTKVRKRWSEPWTSKWLWGCSQM